MYEELVHRLTSAIEKSGVSSIVDIWEVFKVEFSKLKSENNSRIKDLGIQTELDEGSVYSSPCFYYAFHYRLEYVEDGEVYSHYELVYCEFDLATSDVLDKFQKAALDLWLNEYDEKSIFSKIESWEV